MPDNLAPVEAPAPSPPAAPTSPFPASSTVPAAVAALLTIGYALLFGWLSLRSYWSYQMHALDMGNMGQAAWNTVHGHPFYFTNMRLPYNIEAWGTTTRLSFHVEPLFPLLALSYIVYPHPEALLILQTCALAAGALPVYQLAREVLGRGWLPVAFVISYLLFPALEGMNLYEFHPVALATPLLLFAFLFAWRRQYVPFIISGVAAMATKEEIGLVLAMFGLYVAFINRDRLVGLATAAMSLLWSLFAALVVEHHYRAPGSKSYLESRYGYLGHGIHGVLHTVFHDPGVFFTIVGTWPKAGYLNQLLAPEGYLAFFAAPAFLLGAPTLALNLLSTDFHMYSALGDNSAELIAVASIAAILGARVALMVLSQRFAANRVAAISAIYLVVVSIWNQHLNGFTPLGDRWQVPSIGTHQKVADRFVTVIPSGVPVSTQDELDPHLSSRHYLYLFPDTGRRPNPPLPAADYILLDASGPVYPLASGEIHDAAVQYIQRSGWGVAAAQDGLILIRRGASAKHIPSAFYRYMNAYRSPQARLFGSEKGLNMLGYDANRTDLANHRVPNLGYTIYLRPARQISSNLQPVVFEMVQGKMIGCAHIALGLAWYPTTRWHVGQAYVVRLQPLETAWETPALAHLYVDIQGVPKDPNPPCSLFWRHHGRLFPAGRLSISF